MRKGFTLVECMLAAAIFCLLTLVLFEGVIVSTKIGHENADVLIAEGIAWDAVWKRFNENVDGLTIETTAWQLLADEAAPQLAVYDTAPKIRIRVEASDLVGWSANLRKISADVEWGPSSRRRRLSDYREVPVVYRGELGRVY